MKKIFATLVFGLIAVSCFGQKKDIIIVPRVIMETGTVVEALFDTNSQQVVLDINGNDNNESLIVSIEKDGVILDEQVSFMENDHIVVNTDIEIDGNCKVIVRQKHEEVEVAETSEETEE